MQKFCFWTIALISLCTICSFGIFRTHKQYFYMNQASGESQWEYPVEAMLKEQERMGVTGKEDSQATFNRASSIEGTIDSKESLINIITSTGKFL